MANRRTIRRPMGPARRQIETRAQVWQRELTLKCDKNLANDGVDVVQPASMWLRTQELSGIVIRSDLFKVDTNVHVYLETSPTLDGPWNAAADLTTAGVSETTLQSSSSSQLLTGYLRWRVAFTGASGTAWTVCFKLTAYPVETNNSKLQLSPRVA